MCKCNSKYNITKEVNRKRSFLVVRDVGALLGTQDNVLPVLGLALNPLALLMPAAGPIFVHRVVASA